MTKRVFALGWDVGGWQGKANAVAAASWNGSEVQWPGSRSFKLPREGDDPLDVGAIVAKLGDQATESFERAQATGRVVVAVDAPLGFPVGFAGLVAGASGPCCAPRREIDSLFAYRETDRHVYETFGKKPLSAAFDKLGNPATVAISHVRRWCDDGFRVVPLATEGTGGKNIIEVYPALAKQEQKRDGTPLGWLEPIVGEGWKKDGTRDEQDAVLCAAHALCFALGNDGSGTFPRLERPAEWMDEHRREGWVFFVRP